MLDIKGLLQIIASLWMVKGRVEVSQWRFFPRAKFCLDVAFG